MMFTTQVGSTICGLSVCGRLFDRYPALPFIAARGGRDFYMYKGVNYLW